MMKKFSLAILVALATALVSEQSQAQCGNYMGGMYGGFFGYDIGRLYSVLSQNVPYYAAFPPVYYSAPVPRTYGYSPFAYPPGTMTPEIVEMPVAQEITNPYVVPSSVGKSESPTASEAPADRVTMQPASSLQVIINPYVSQHVAEAAGPAVHAASLHH